MNLNVNLKQIEQGLSHKYWGTRLDFAQRTYFIPTAEQIERGLTDENWHVRRAFAKRLDFTPTPDQILRGLGDPHKGVSGMFQKRHAEWTARWEAQELKIRHIRVIIGKPEMKAL